MNKMTPMWSKRKPCITQIVSGCATVTKHPISSRTEWVLWLFGSAQLTRTAIKRFNAYICKHPTAIFAYSDHRVTGKASGCDELLLKPSWSLDLVRASAYPGKVIAIRADAFSSYLEQASNPTPYELMLYLGAHHHEKKFIRIPEVLWSTTMPCKTFRQKYVLKTILKNHLKQINLKADITETPERYLKINYAILPEPPMVSIIIPTHNMLNHLEACIESLLNKTTYQNYEVIVIDNQSDDKETLNYLNKITIKRNIRLLKHPHPFNFSAINNFAAQQARGDMLCLLNNDTEIISPDWLEHLVSQLLQPGVGVVGAKLLYTNGTVQHAGDAIGVAGCAGHMHGGIDAESPGYMGRAMLTQDLSAVTGACLLTYKSLYQELGGLDEKHLAVAFNDVDYCLRTREANKKVIFVPDALLYHYESVSRGGKISPEKKRRIKKEVAYMHKRWKQVITQDPFYHPCMNKQKADFTLATQSRRIWSWK